MENLHNCTGLVFGFVFRGGEGHLVRDETLHAALDEGADWVWLHLGLSDHRARRFLNDFPELPEAGRTLLLGGETRIQIHLSQDHAAGVLPDIEKDFDDQSLEPGRLAFWLNGRILVTTRRKPVRAAQGLQEALSAGLTLEDPAAALARLQTAYAELVEARLIKLGADLDQIEDKVLADRAGLDHLPLGPLRRELSRHHREFAALRGAIHRAGFARLTGETPLSRHLPTMHQDAEDFERDAGALQDRARLLYEEVNTRIAATTNRSLSALTVISTLLLPPTFVAGAFGMNVGGLPWAQDKEGFWLVLGFCVFLIGLSYIVLRRFRILP
ncbi:MAG TPA: CorA family divalent cation transporter [Rhizomicrobium sp.]|jgi:zinc transporter